MTAPANAMPSPAPKVSVIVPCYNAGRTLGACVSALLEQDYPDYEIILVDDNSTDGSVQRLGASDRLRVLRNDVNRGPAYSRNRGIAESGGSVLLLIDSDCIIEDRQLITRHVRAHQSTPAHVIGGGIQGVGKGCVARADKYSHWMLNIPHSANQVGTHLVTNNMSIQREVFARLGGFDVSLRTGEDTDFCERAIKAGFRLGLDTSIIVKHQDRERLRDFLRCFYLVGIDRIPTRKKKKHRYAFLLPAGPVSAPFYWLPLASLLTLQVVLAWLPYDKGVLLYSPLIFLGRLAMATGIVAYCFKRPTS